MFLRRLVTTLVLSVTVLFCIPPLQSQAQVEINARVEFFNKKILEGRIIFTSSNVALRHVEKELLSLIEVAFSEIEFIHPITWTPEFQKVENEGKLAYNFYPTEYLVKLKDGKYLNVVGRVPSFEVISFVHKYGKSKLYTYYVDYLIQDKGGETKWKNMNTYELNKNFKKPHPNVVYYIYLR
ncbi:MAG: hypothetical protein ABDH28_02605 [Brevinematia bacterium]